MSILDIFKIDEIKAELAQYKTELEKCKKENDRIQAILSRSEKMTLFEIQEEITRLTALKSQLQQESNTLSAEIEAKKNDVIVYEEEALLQSFGFYKTRYALNNSFEYKTRLDAVREQQAQMVKSDKAATCTQNWTVNNSTKEGARMTADYIKLIVRSFNNECDACIVSVKFNNIDSIEKRIRKAFETLNKLGQRMTITLSQQYLDLKLQELYLCYEYQVKKQEEKEEQKRLREQMREDAKVQREIEEAKLRVEKEEKHFIKAIQKISEQLATAKTEDERIIFEEQKRQLEGKLTVIEKDKLDILNREQNTRAGYVYIISNVGSFGKNVYKIGVTRRLDPSDRVDELGDASVPFDFDIHAAIFSDDAPRLETALHRAFDHRRLNLINNRREFFYVTLEEIEAEVKKNFNKAVEFVRIPEADEFRQSMAIRQKAKASQQPAGVKS